MAHRPILKLALVGYGSTARVFLSLLHEKLHDLPFTPAVAGLIYKKKGFHGFLSKAVLLEEFRVHPPQMHQFTGGVHRFLKKIDADVLVELTPLNIQNGEPAASYLRAGLNNGLHVLTANKGPLAFHFTELAELANQKKRRFRFGATVSGGLPVFSMKRYAAPLVKFTSVRAHINATTNYVIARMHEGIPEMQAVAEAQASGLCNNTPQLDLDGWDGAIQSAILANVLMQNLDVQDVFRENFRQRAPEIIKRAVKGTHKIRQIVNIENVTDEMKASVRLQVLSKYDPFYHLQAGDCAITLKRKTVGEFTMTVRMPDREQIAATLLADLCDIYYSSVVLQKEPELFELDRDALITEKISTS